MITTIRSRPRVVTVAVAVLGVILAASIAAPLLAPADPLGQDLRNAFARPSRAHWLGTDWLGRDVLSRLLYAGRASLLAAVQATLVATIVGAGIGLVAGYVGGFVDRMLSWVIDALLALPGLVLALAVVAVLGPGLTNAMLAVGVVLAPLMARLTRGLTASIVHRPFVDAARLSGTSTFTTLRVHIVPNIAAPVGTQVALVFGLALLVEAGISVLGLGVQPPDASWGGMLAQATPHMRRDGWLVVPPGLAIVVTVLCVNLLADGLRSGGRPPSALPASRTGRPVSAVHDRPRARLEVRGLEVVLDGQNTIVNGVDLTVLDGEILGIVGESGSGKSVTANALLGLHPAASVRGSIRLVVDGSERREMVGAEESAWNDVRATVLASVPQHPNSSLHPGRRVGAQFSAFLRARSNADGAQRRLAMEQALARAGLDDPSAVLASWPHELSGGMSQRVAIAMAIALRPAILVADEPTSALDVTHQARILDLLTELRTDQGLGVVLVSHDLAVIERICDRVAVMYAGEVVEEGPVADVLGRPRHPYTRALVGATPRRGVRASEMAELGGHVPPPGARPDGCRFAPRCPRRADGCGERIALVEGVRCIQPALVDPTVEAVRMVEEAR